jgi:hypothetical protein
VVDVGIGPPPKFGNLTDEEFQLHHELLALIQACFPEDKNSPLASYLPGFTSLRLLLIQQSRSPRDDELLKSVLSSYASYKKGGHRTDMDIASMTARDFMLLSKLSHNNPPRLEPSKAADIRPRQLPAAPHQRVDPDPLLALISLHRQTGGPNTSIAQQAPGPLHGQQHNTNRDGDSTLEGVLQNFMNSQFSGHDFHASPVLHPLFTSQEQFASLGASPSLHPISSDANDGVLNLQNLGLSASQIALVQNDSSMQYRGFNSPHFGGLQ